MANVSYYSELSQIDSLTLAVPLSLVGHLSIGKTKSDDDDEDEKVSFRKFGCTQSSS